MTKTKELSDRELDAEIADKVMGWRLLPGQWSHPIYEDANCNVVFSADMYTPSITIALAFAMETEIERQGKSDDYGKVLFYSLCDTVKGWADIGDIESVAMFKLAHASPRARCLAALEVFAETPTLKVLEKEEIEK